MRLAALNIALALLVPLAVGKPRAQPRRPCGSFVAKQQRLYVYREHGSAGCAEARHVLQAWFADRRMTRRYGGWTCFDASRAALVKGQIQYCKRGPRDRIADFDHRLPARSARM